MSSGPEIERKAYVGEARIRVVLMVPLCFNDGRTVPDEVHHRFEHHLAGYFGGWTRLHARRGSWHGQREDMRPYEVWVRNLLGSADQIKRCASMALAMYQQEAIAVEYLGLAELVEGGAR